MPEYSKYFRSILMAKPVDLAIEVNGNYVLVRLDETTDAQIEAQKIAEQCYLSQDEQQRVQEYIDQMLYSRFLESSGYNEPIQLQNIQNQFVSSYMSPKAKVQEKYVQKINANATKVLELYDSELHSPPKQQYFLRVSENRYRLVPQQPGLNQKESCERLSKPKNISKTILTSIMSKNSSEYSKDHSKIFGQNAPQSEVSGTIDFKKQIQRSFQSNDQDAKQQKQQKEKEPCYERLYRSAYEQKQHLKQLQDENDLKNQLPKRFVSNNTGVYDRQMERQIKRDANIEKLRNQKKNTTSSQDMHEEEKIDDTNKESLQFGIKHKPTQPYGPAAYARWEDKMPEQDRKARRNLIESTAERQVEPFKVSKAVNQKDVERSPKTESPLTKRLKKRYAARAQICFPNQLARLCNDVKKPVTQGVVLIKEKHSGSKIKNKSDSKSAVDLSREQFVLV